MAEPWRCAVCNLFVYNTTAFGHPMPGAPQPWRCYDDVTGTVQWICSVCQAMRHNAVAEIAGFNTDYWKKLHEEWVTREKKRRENNQRLNGDKDYFTGA